MALSAPVFLSHYTIRVGKKVGWVSLAPLPNTSLFTAYTASYNGFKDRFLKIKALGEGLPLKALGTHKSQLSPEEKVTLQLLDELPRGMNCREIVSLVIGRKPVSHLRRMIEDEGIDMAALIKKVKLARRAGSRTKPIESAVETRSTLVAETSSAYVAEMPSAPVAEMQPVPMPRKESVSMAEEVVVLAAARTTTTSVQAELGPALVETRPSISDAETREAKRKAESAATEEASKKKGKSAVPPGLTLVDLSEKSKVTITSDLELPPGGLSYFSAPTDVRSLWGPNMNIHSLFPPSAIPQYDRSLLVIAWVDGTFDMLEEYHLQSLASLEVSRGLVKRVEQILLKEALNKKKFEKVAKANHDLRAEGE
ncbi:hypothetical protein CR513_42297, partial [Mucuna pruriens]